MTHSSASSPRETAYAALGAGLLTLSAWLSIPVGDLAVTMQTFAFVLLLDLLGGRRTALCCTVYLALGMTGLPVFSLFRGGLGVLLGPTGGYLWGLLPGALVWWALRPRGRRRYAAAALALGLCSLGGTAWYWGVYASGGDSWWAVALHCAVPYVLPDALKAVLALRLSARLRPMVKL